MIAGLIGVGRYKDKLFPSSQNFSISPLGADIFLIGP